MPLPRSLFRSSFAATNTQPTSTPVDAATEKAKVTSTLDTALNSSTGDDKDVRAYEHDRQRTKKAADFVKTRIRRTQLHAPEHKPSETSPNSTGSRKSSHSKSNSNHDRLDKASLIEAVEQARLPVYEKPNMKPLYMLPEARPPPDSHVEVKLIDLITTSTRKPKGAKVADDFEVIPHMRSVIVLDDAMSADDFPFDEPWEHIYADSELTAAVRPAPGLGAHYDATIEAYKGPSYASVLARDMDSGMEDID